MKTRRGKGRDCKPGLASPGRPKSGGWHPGIHRKTNGKTREMRKQDLGSGGNEKNQELGAAVKKERNMNGGQGSVSPWVLNTEKKHLGGRANNFGYQARQQEKWTFLNTQRGGWGLKKKKRNRWGRSRPNKTQPGEVQKKEKSGRLSQRRNLKSTPALK